MSGYRASNPKVGFVSLGCPKALVDSERILTQLRIDGYEIVPTYEAADIVVVNTCGFIDSAKQESLDAIGEAIEANGRVIVTGCLGANEQAIRHLRPQVLGISGPQQYARVVEAVRMHAPIRRPHDPRFDLVPPHGIKLTPPHYAYLKIAEGCNHRCTFCIIPSMRGPLASRPVGDVLEEAERLVAAGVRELVVIAQDTSAYGADAKYRTGFWHGRPVRGSLEGLCRALGGLGVWVRLLYVYPYPHVDGLLPLMAEGRILPYLDVPFQHASPRLLRAMRRPAAAEDMLERIGRWRSICPELTIRSTFIVGFPGETAADFETLLAFLEEAALDRVGCFQYSPVDGAEANALARRVPDDLKQARWDRLMQTQAEISRRRLAAKVGQRLEVLLDSLDGPTAIGRSAADAPEIDGLVFVARAAGRAAGDIVRVLIERSDTYDLHGRAD